MEEIYRIAIGDDDPVFLREAEALVAACMDAAALTRGRDYDVDCFLNAVPLLEALGRDQNRYQLLLLDVRWGGENGLQVAAALRKSNSQFSLIYVTRHRDYVFDSFDTRPLHYLLKPVDPDKLAELIREDYRRRYQDARLYLRAGSKHLSLAYQDIYAVEAALHRVFFHLRSGGEEWGAPWRR